MAKAARKPKGLRAYHQKFIRKRRYLVTVLRQYGGGVVLI